MSKYKHFCRAKCPTVTIDEESFNNMEKEIETYWKTIDQKVAEKLETTGIDINIKIYDTFRTLRYNAPIVRMGEWGFPCSLIEESKNKIINDIVDIANKKLSDKKQEIINEAMQRITDRELILHKCNKIFAFWMIVFLATTLLFLFMWLSA